MRLFQKLIVGNLVGIAVFAVALLWSVHSVERAEVEIDQIIEETLPVRNTLQDLRFFVLRIISSTSEHMFLAAVRDEVEKKEDAEASLQVEKSLIEKGKTNYKSTFVKYEKLVKEYFPDEIEDMKKLRDQGDIVFSLADQIRHLTKQKASPEELFEVKEHLEVAETNFVATIKSILRHEQEEITERREALENTIRTNTKILIAFVIFAFSVIIGTSFYFSRSLIIRIRKLSNSTRDIADGKFIQIMPDDFQDELGSLSRDFSIMNNNLQVAQAQRQELVEELKAKAEDLKEALTKEQEFHKLQREIVSMVSHEFRTPLAVIDTTAQRMKSRADQNRLTPEDAAQRVEKIRDAVQRMTRLMESTLDAARMEEGKIKVKIKPCDIGKVVHEVCARQKEATQTHVISCDLADLPVTIQADSGYVEQVLANLLSNAVKYAPDAPDIEVMARTEGHQVVISVRDYGVGIDEDDLGSIGERFFRAKTSTGITGTGIGLNLAKTLVEMHGGTVSVESQKGEGSTFIIRLPIAGPDQSEQAETRAA